MLITIIGILLLGLLIVDLFLTAFHSEGRSGPLNQVQNRTTWILLRGVGRMCETPTRRVLHSLAGPIISIVTIISWVLLLILGYACIYYPHIQGFVYAHAEAGHPIIETIYYSGYVAATLGLGDVIASGNTLRTLTVLQALTGFAIFGVAVTYVLGVFQEVRRMKVLATVINNYFEQGVDHVLSLPRSMDSESLASWCADTSVTLLEVLEAQMQYPLLHYFRPVEPSRSLVVQMEQLIEFLKQTDTRHEGGDLATLRGHPAFQQLQTAVERYLVELSKHFVPSWVGEVPVTGDDGELQRHHKRLMIYLDQ